MLTLSYDATTGLVHTVAAGSTNREQVENYLFTLEGMIERARTEWGRYWHLVDAREVQIQSAEALNCLAGSSIEQLGPDDRTAVAMTSTDAIDQLAAMPSQFMTRVFADLDVARACILTDWTDA